MEDGRGIHQIAVGGSVLRGVPFLLGDLPFDVRGERKREGRRKGEGGFRMGFRGEIEAGKDIVFIAA